MGDIVKSLRFLEFPECTKQALKFLATALSSSSAGDGKYIADVCQDYILFRRTSHRKQLNAIQELQLLELLCGFLEGLADGVRTAAFAFIFGGRINTSKVELLTKLVSMGISVQSKPVLDSVADWMQDHGCDSEHVLNVTRTLIEDHCRLFPDTTCAFRSLPSISPLLACNLMCAVTSLYRYNDVSGSPPGVLVEYVTDWIITDPALCAASLLTFSSPHMMAEGSERHCPLTGLLRWCAFGPLVEKSHLKGANSESCNILTVFSKLHLALLQTLLSFYHEHCQLLTLKNIELLVRDFALVSKNQDEDSRQFAIERLAQAFQVGISSGNLRCSPRELSLVVQSLMPNRLLNSVVNQGSTQNAVPMEVT